MDPTVDPSAPAGGTIDIPDIVPDFNSEGVVGLTSMGATIAAWALVLAGIAIIIGVIMAVAGPRFGFQGARSVGMGGIVGGLAVGAVVAMATPAVETTFGWFA